jgi:hypothetical protein
MSFGFAWVLKAVQVIKTHFVSSGQNSLTGHKNMLLSAMRTARVNGKDKF